MFVRARSSALVSRAGLKGGSVFPPRTPRFSLSARTLSTTSPRSQTHASLVEFGQRHVTKGIGRQVEAIIEKGEGSYLTLGDGRKMLDFTCGIAVTNLGHCHPKVSAAAAEQCMKLVHGQCSIGFHGPYLELIQRLLPMMPHPSLDSFYFWNSGSEAIEGAIKMARSVSGRQNIITLQGAYHGRTYGALALTKSKTVYAEGFHPLMPGVFTAPFPYWHHFSLPPTTPASELTSLCLNQLELLLQQQSAPKDTAAIILEPVIGEGGYVPAPPEYLKGLREICDREGILLIVDEVQSGFLRTGKNFAIEYSGVRPDIMTVAKGLANGFPLSGIITRREISDGLRPGSMGGTYAGNAVACAAAVATADAFKNENILENVNARSKELFGYLEPLRSNPAILDIRGLGLMVAVEFASPTRTSVHDPLRNPHAPAKLASRVAKRCQEKGMFLLTTSAYEVVRFMPALNVSKEDLKKGCDIFVEAVDEIVREG
ncbi:pyridoxal phosphate-dependent transferase [Cristinia sonorae]|uniref:Pyridoxal phosphate-dependent transferase n=1 Tax=Cristinia sonorae TaxID=1940300 RepID=A0A8K0V152_9AGAR|nr:pyridoxal phosphate-dependent transferase [Cristinia sonorae]